MGGDSGGLKALRPSSAQHPTLEFLVFTSAPLAISSRARDDSPTLTALMSSIPSCFCEAHTACAERQEQRREAAHYLHDGGITCMLASMARSHTQAATGSTRQQACPARHLVLQECEGPHGEVTASCHRHGACPSRACNPVERGLSNSSEARVGWVRASFLGPHSSLADQPQCRATVMAWSSALLWQWQRDPHGSRRIYAACRGCCCTSDDLSYGPCGRVHD